MAQNLTAEADRLGTTPELLALDSVRKNLPVQPTPLPTEGTLLDFLSGYVGTVAGSTRNVTLTITTASGPKSVTKSVTFVKANPC